MGASRKLVFTKNNLYHVFNRGVERRPIFTKTKEYKRAVDLLNYYQYAVTPLRFSQFLLQPAERQEQIINLMTKSGKQIEIISYCLMPNHFHFLIRQVKDNGIPEVISNFTNAYTKYFNTKYDRVGPLLQGTFKAVRVESDEQLIHLSRYIHLNPVTSSLVELSSLPKYEWSSYPSYANNSQNLLVSKGLILSYFKNPNQYKSFVEDQADYAKKLGTIKHLSLEQ